MTLVEKLRYQQSYYNSSEGDVCSKFHGNRLNSCQDISMKAKKCQLRVGAIEEKPKGRQSQ